MKLSIKHLAVLFTLVSSLFALSACRTSEGFGKDVENLGEKIQDKAN